MAKKAPPAGRARAAAQKISSVTPPLSPKVLKLDAFRGFFGKNV
jgi:hypothetical protein